MDRQTTGRLAEQQAAFWYMRQGFVIIARNWRCTIGEVDLLVTKNNTLHIVEVKALRHQGEFMPEQRIDWCKQRKLQILSAVASEVFGYEDVCIDIVAITGTELHHFTLS
jgi:putative endonuclease